ncbi:MAG: CHAT domain-containing protein [Gemmataceae bacterium]|nr:CHAT domain-containing protein [Gemmataceae bacterium]
MAAIAARAGQAAEADDYRHREQQARFLYLTRSLPYLSPAEQSAFLKDDQSFALAMSQGLRFADRAESRRASAEWLLNSKGAAFRALAKKELEVKRASTGSAKDKFEELRATRALIASMSTGRYKVEEAPQVRKEIDVLLAREANLGRELAELVGLRFDDQWTRLADVQSNLGPDDVLVDLAAFPRTTPFDDSTPAKEVFAAWIVRKDAVDLVDLGDAEPIRQGIETLRKHLEDASKRIREEGEAKAEKQYREAGAALAAKVLNPLLPYLKGKKNWIVSPDGALWVVPWAALPLPDDRYVAERHSVRYAVSGRELLPTAASPVRPNNPVIVADPNFDAGRSHAPVRRSNDQRTAFVGHLSLGEIPRLPGTRAEAATIRPQLEKYSGLRPHLIVEDDATADVLLRLRNPRVLVLSTHAFFSPDRRGASIDNPLLRCGLLMAGCNAAESQRTMGVLTGLDVLAADLRGCEFVLLSACETGLGDVAAGNGVAGLRQAFHLAGAESVAATLWRVPDRATAELVSSFFAKLAAGGTKSSALRDAQAAMIAQRREDYGAAHPYFWAAWTLTGADLVAPRLIGPIGDRPALGPLREPIEWQANYAAGSKAAAAEKKPMVVFVGRGPTGYRTAIADERIPDEMVLLLSDFVCVYLDTNTDTGAAMARAFEMDGPGLIISRPGGQVIHQTLTKPLAISDLMKELNMARKAKPE